MNDLELRERFAQWAAPLRSAAPPDVTVICRRVRRRRTAAAAAAGVTAACVVASVVIALMAAGGLTRSARPPQAPAQVFGRGRYPSPRTGPYLILNSYGRGYLRVIDAANGRVLAQEMAPFTDVTPEAGGRTFIALGTSFDQISVRAGRVSMRTIMAGVTIPARYQPYGMSVNPQGTRLAVSAAPDGSLAMARLYVFNLKTGAVIDSLDEGDAQVTLQYWPSATRLAFSYVSNYGSRGNGLRVLDTSAAVRTGTGLVAVSRPDPRLSRYAGAQLTTDGATAIEVEQAGNAVILSEYAVATGRLLHAVTIGTAAALNQSADACGVLWASPGGADLLTQCGSQQLEIIDGRVTSSRFAAVVPQSQVGWADSFAW
jgi:hypothetical protein